MMPALAIFAIGPRSRWLLPLPFPLFLLWPAVFVARGLIRLAELVRPRGRPAGTALAGVKAALAAFAGLRGLRIDVRSESSLRMLILFW